MLLNFQCLVVICAHSSTVNSCQVLSFSNSVQRQVACSSCIYYILPYYILHHITLHYIICLFQICILHVIHFPFENLINITLIKLMQIHVSMLFMKCILWHSYLVFLIIKFKNKYVPLLLTHQILEKT